MFVLGTSLNVYVFMSDLSYFMHRRENSDIFVMILYDVSNV